VHYWTDLQSAHGLRCYGNIMQTRNVSEYMLVLALCLVCDSDGDTPTLPWELLYADDLIVIAESEEELTKSFIDGRTGCIIKLTVNGRV